MVIDTSALIAILHQEVEEPMMVAAIEEADRRYLSAATFVETSIVVDARKGSDGLAGLDLFIAAASIELVEVDSAQAMTARTAYHRYGKGRHPAGLNFGDCFSYALAVNLGHALLFKGDDFAKTDVRSVLSA